MTVRWRGEERLLRKLVGLLARAGGIVGEHDDVLRRPPSPRRELGQLGDPDLLPIQAMLPQEREERAQVVRVCLDRVRERSLFVSHATCAWAAGRAVMTDNHDDFHHIRRCVGGRVPRRARSGDPRVAGALRRVAASADPGKWCKTEAVISSVKTSGAHAAASSVTSCWDLEERVPPD